MKKAAVTAHAQKWNPRITITPVSADAAIGIEETLEPTHYFVDLDESDPEEPPTLRGPLSED